MTTLENRSNTLSLTPVSDALPVDKTFRLTEVANLLKTYPQEIISYIHRYEVVFTQHDSSTGINENAFTKFDIQSLELMFSLRERGIPPQEAAAIALNFPELINNSLLFLNFISELGHSKNQAVLLPLIQLIAELPDLLSEQEKKMLVATEGKGKNLLNASIEAGATTGREGKRILSSAYEKIGFYMLLLLRLGVLTSQADKS